MNKLITQILTYFKAELVGEMIKHNGETYQIKTNVENFELDLFVYLYNDNKKYTTDKATFYHILQPERKEALNEYLTDGNFSKFRIKMNKLLNNSYYIGQPTAVRKYQELMWKD